MSSAGARSLSAPPHPGEKGQVRAGAASSQGWGGTTQPPTQQSGRGGILQLEDAARAWGPTASVGCTPCPGLCHRGVSLPAARVCAVVGSPPSPQVCAVVGSPSPPRSVPSWVTLPLAPGLRRHGVSPMVSAVVGFPLRLGPGSISSWGLPPPCPGLCRWHGV